MRVTSAIAYQQALETGLLAHCASLVYKSVAINPNKTANEHHRMIEIEERRAVNKPSITPLFAPLRDAGWIMETGERECTVSGKKCIIYEITGKIGTRISKGKRVKKNPEADEWRKKYFDLLAAYERLSQPVKAVQKEMEF